MPSMTGYGKGTARSEAHGVSLSVELTTLNRKTLDCSYSGPKEWSGLEQRCKEWILPHFSRGRVQIQIKLLHAEGEQSAHNWNFTGIQAQLERLQHLAAASGVPFQADTQLLWDLAQSVQGQVQLPDWLLFEETIHSAVLDALEDLNAMRRKEGQHLGQDLAARLQGLGQHCQLISEHSETAVADHRDRLFARLKQLNLELSLDDERVLKELALFADRTDISEEITRLASHLEQFQKLLAVDGPRGRKLDFLCQEIHRELNTCGSKTTQIEVTRAVIEAKNGLESMREQVQNLE